MEVASHTALMDPILPELAFGAGRSGAQSPDDSVHLHRRRHRHPPTLDAAVLGRQCAPAGPVQPGHHHRRRAPRHLHRNQPTSHTDARRHRNPGVRPTTTASARCGATVMTRSASTATSTAPTSSATAHAAPARAASGPAQHALAPHPTLDSHREFRAGSRIRAQTRHPARSAHRGRHHTARTSVAGAAGAGRPSRTRVAIASTAPNWFRYRFCCRHFRPRPPSMTHRHCPTSGSSIRSSSTSRG